MTLRDAVSSVLGKIKNRITSIWREIGGFTASFSSFGRDVYANEIARSCIRTLSDHRSKANVKVLRNKSPGDLRLQKMIENRPNLYMNGKDYLYKISAIYERYNTVFVFINRDDAGNCIGLYPIPNCGSEAVESDGRLYIKFYLPNGTQLVASWEDLIVLRKDFCDSDIYGDDNSAILTSLELLNTTSEGMANAIKSTANLRGIVKSTKAMLSPEDQKRMKDQFVADYLAMENSSGIAVLDATQDFTPVTMTPVIANYKNVEELRNNIYRYWGISEKIVTCTANADEREAFYERHVETFLLALSLEHTNKIFTDRQRSIATEIIFESNRMSYMSMTEKLALVSMVDRGAMTPNEWRQALNLAPIDGGDLPIRRLDTAPTGAQPTTSASGIVDDAEKIAGKTLNGAQTASLISVIAQYQAGTLTLGQAVNIISISIGITKDEAKALIEGSLEGENNASQAGTGLQGNEPAAPIDGQTAQ